MPERSIWVLGSLFERVANEYRSTVISRHSDSIRWPPELSQSPRPRSYPKSRFADVKHDGPASYAAFLATTDDAEATAVLRREAVAVVKAFRDAFGTAGAAG
jgi:hypothetical protein